MGATGEGAMLAAMYAPFFGLEHLPFSIAPDPRYLFMSERHREALERGHPGIGRLPLEQLANHVLDQPKLRKTHEHGKKDARPQTPVDHDLAPEEVIDRYGKIKQIH